MKCNAPVERDFDIEAELLQEGLCWGLESEAFPWGGFVAEDPRALGTGLQPAGDLLGRPVLMEPLDHEGRQLRQAVEQQAVPSPRQIASLGRLRPTGVIGVAVVRAISRPIVDGARPRNLAIARFERPVA